MIRILNTFYKSPEVMSEKAILGHLISNPLQVDSYELVDECKSEPTLILLHIDTVESPSEETLLEVIKQFNCNKGNKIVIDTSVEDFIVDTFFNSTKFLEDNGVPNSAIFVITGQQNAPMFQFHYDIPYTTFSYNLFEMGYYRFITHLIDNKGYKLNDIQPRHPNKHFLSLIKNPRKLRRIFHSYMSLNNLYDNMIHSWHKTGHYTINDWHDLKYLEIIDKGDDWDRIQFKLDTLKTQGSIQGSREWHIPDEILNDVAVNLAHETHFFLDSEGIRDKKIDEIPWGHRYFITEKTFKNFALGLPFINPGIPGSEQLLRSLGYYAWDSMLGIDTRIFEYTTCIKTYMQLIQDICNMPISELNDILNSEQSLDMLKHNRERFFEQKQFYKLLQDLETINSMPI